MQLRLKVERNLQSTSSISDNEKPEIQCEERLHIEQQQLAKGRRKACAQGHLLKELLTGGKLAGVNFLLQVQSSQQHRSGSSAFSN